MIRDPSPGSPCWRLPEWEWSVAVGFTPSENGVSKFLKFFRGISSPPANKFDYNWLVREIVNSQAYQIEDIGKVTDVLPRYYERARIRPLIVEELIASLHIATGLGVESAIKKEPS